MYISIWKKECTYVVQGQTGELVKKIMKQAEEKNSDDIVMIVPFDNKTLTWKPIQIDKLSHYLILPATSIEFDQKRYCVIIFIEQQAIQ